MPHIPGLNFSMLRVGSGEEREPQAPLMVRAAAEIDPRWHDRHRLPVASLELSKLSLEVDKLQPPHLLRRSTEVNLRWPAQHQSTDSTSKELASASQTLESFSELSLDMDGGESDESGSRPAPLLRQLAEADLHWPTQRHRRGVVPLRHLHVHVPTKHLK